MIKRNTAIAWGPYQDWAEAKSWQSDSENQEADHYTDEGNPGLWGPLFAAIEEQSSVLPSSVAARRALRTFLEFVEQVRSHEAPVRPPKPPEASGFELGQHRPWKPYRLVPAVGPGKVVLKKGRYQVLFLAGDPTSLLKLAELNDDVNVRKGALIINGGLSSLVRNDTSAMEMEATIRTAGLNVVWDGQLQSYLANKRQHLLRQQAPFEAVPEGLRTEHRSFSAMPKKLRRRLAPAPSDRVPESLRPQYLHYRRRLVELGLVDKLNEMQAHDAALLACKERAIAAHEQGLGKTRTCITAALLNGCRSVLVVCYSRLVEVWQREFEALGLGDQVQTVESRKDISSSKRFHIISYERLAASTERSTDLRCSICGAPLSPGLRRCPACRRLISQPTGCRFCGADRGKTITYCRHCGYYPRVYTPPIYWQMRRRYNMAIFDESQAAKSRSAQRSRACAALRTKRTLLATGTMLENYVYVQCPVMCRRVILAVGGERERVHATPHNLIISPAMPKCPVAASVVGRCHPLAE